MRGSPNQDGVMVVRIHHLAEKINTVEAPYDIYSRTKFQLFNSITSWDMDYGVLYFPLV